MFEQCKNSKKAFAINFCHPKTNTRNTRSGLFFLNRFPYLFYILSDLMLKLSKKVSPKFTEVFILRAYRKFVYKFRIMNGVDTMYLSILKNKKNDASEDCQVYLQASSLKAFLGK